MLEWSHLALLPVSDSFSKFVRMKTLSHLVVAKICSLCSCDALSQVELPETLVAPLSQESNITERYEPFTCCLGRENVHATYTNRGVGGLEKPPI